MDASPSIRNSSTLRVPDTRRSCGSSITPSPLANSSVVIGERSATVSVAMLGSGAFGGGTLGHRLFRGALRGRALRERSLCFGATLCRGALRLGPLQARALGGGLLRCGAKLLLCSPLFGRTALLDR